MKKLLIFALGLLSFLGFINVVNAEGNIKVPAPVNFPAVEIGNVISAVIGVMLIVGAVLALVYLILGGIQWITSGGDKQGLEGARNKITAAIVGLIIVASTWAIMLLLSQFVGLGDIFGTGLKIPTIQNPGGGTSGCPTGWIRGSDGTCVKL